MIGDYEACGLSRKRYRTALSKLEKQGFITKKGANKGTIVSLINTEVCGYGGPIEGHQESNKRLTSVHQETTNKKERKKESKESKNILPPLPPSNKLSEVKTSYTDNVFMTKTEYDNLLAQHGHEATQRLIEILDNYKGSSGKKYKSDYRAILSWVVSRYKEEQILDARRVKFAPTAEEQPPF